MNGNCANYNRQKNCPGRRLDYETVSNVDPYVYQTLMSIIGRNCVIDTTKSTIEGQLTNVQPDHCVIQMMNGQMCYIRIAECVTIIPM